MNKTDRSNNGFLGGLILGVIIGGAFAFLIATKKGKTLLKLLADEGIEGVAELEEIFAGKVLEEKPQVVKKKSIPVLQTEKKNEEVEVIEPEVIEEKKASIPASISRFGSAGRRFFKGTPKRN